MGFAGGVTPGCGCGAGGAAAGAGLAMGWGGGRVALFPMTGVEEEAAVAGVTLEAAVGAAVATGGLTANAGFTAVSTGLLPAASGVALALVTDFAAAEAASTAASTAARAAGRPEPVVLFADLSVVVSVVSRGRFDAGGRCGKATLAAAFAEKEGMGVGLVEVEVVGAELALASAAVTVAAAAAAAFVGAAMEALKDSRLLSRCAGSAATALPVLRMAKTSPSFTTPSSCGVW